LVEAGRNGGTDKNRCPLDRSETAPARLVLRDLEIDADAQGRAQVFRKRLCGGPALVLHDLICLSDCDAHVGVWLGLDVGIQEPFDLARVRPLHPTHGRDVAPGDLLWFDPVLPLRLPNEDTIHLLTVYLDRDVLTASEPGATHLDHYGVLDG
jgi:hypothetical protein